MVIFPKLRRVLLAALAFALPFVSTAPRADAATVLDEFEDLSGWTVTSAHGATAEIAHDQGRNGMALRVDYDFAGGGFVIVRKSFPIDLPPNYAFQLGVRGTGEPNNLEFKLVDPSGDTVWWSVLRDYELPEDWETLSVKRARMR